MRSCRAVWGWAAICIACAWAGVATPKQITIAIACIGTPPPYPTPVASWSLGQLLQVDLELVIEDAVLPEFDSQVMLELV